MTNSPASARDAGSTPGLRRSPRGGNVNPLQCSCLEKPHGWRSLVGYSPQGLKELDTTEHSRSPPYPSLRLHCDETSVKCVVRGTEKSMAISNLLKAPNPLPSGLTKCAQEWVGIKSGVGAAATAESGGDSLFWGGGPGKQVQPLHCRTQAPCPSWQPQSRLQGSTHLSAQS